MGLILVFICLLLFQASMQAPRQRTSKEDEEVGQSFDNHDLVKEASHVQDYEGTGSSSASSSEELEDLDPVNRDDDGDGDKEPDDNDTSDPQESISEDDSVAQSIRKNTVTRVLPKVYSNIPDDSVSSYIAHEALNRNGILRNKIPEDDEEDSSDESDENNDTKPKLSDTDSLATGEAKDTITKAKPNEQDSVSSYIDIDNGLPRNEIATQNDDDGEEEEEEEETNEKGETKDTITKAKPNEQDSVSSYIDIDNGLPRNEIATHEEEGNDKKGDTKDTIINAKSHIKDSVSSYIDIDNGLTRNKIVNEPVVSNLEQQQNEEEKEASRKDSVASYINLVDDNQKNKTIQGSEVASGDVPSTDEKESGSKTEEILEGLEDLSLEGSGDREKNETKFMRELNPDMIKAHRMVGELWQEAPIQTSVPLANSTFTYSSPQQQPLYIQPTPYIQPQYTYIDLKFADKKGALCLDGSPPGFFYRRGTGQGEKRWIIYLQGGAWCDSEMDCFERSKSNLGSSLKFKKLINVEGLLSRNFKENPHFYDWNAVYVPYCDGASYTGNRDEAVKVKDRMIYFRGKRILSALLDDLLEYGMSQADKVIFSGTSAGGLAVLLNADYVRERIPTDVHVHSLADAGVFLDVANLNKEKVFGDMMHNVYELHNSSGTINPKCASKQGEANAWKCLFPYYFGEYINSAVFIVNPLYDSWQLGHIVGIHCASNLNKCTKRELKAIVDFRQQTLKHLAPLMNNKMIGTFADGCFDHGQIIFGPKWNKIRVRNRSMSGTFYRWTKNQENAKSIVDPETSRYFFNPTCVTHQLKLSKKSFMESL